MNNPFDNDAPDNLPRHVLLGIDERLIYGDDDEVEELDLGEDEPRHRRNGVDDWCIYGDD